jgi:hypothetical protein
MTPSHLLVFEEVSRTVAYPIFDSSRPVSSRASLSNKGVPEHPDMQWFFATSEGVGDSTSFEVVKAAKLNPSKVVSRDAKIEGFMFP